MQSKISRMAVALLALALIILTVSLVYAQAPAGRAYIVQPGDRLADIAAKFLGNSAAYRDIIAATNARAAEDPSFKPITDPNLIQAGQKLWIPTAELAGIYVVMLPGASSPGLDMTLYLNADDTARQVSDYLNGEAPLVEVGTWQMESGRVVVTFTGQAGQQPYQRPATLTLRPDDGGLTTVPAEDTAGTGRWTYLPFEALAQGQLPAPYNRVQASRLISDTGVTGIYKGFLPAATCCGQDITLFLNFDNSVTLKTDFLNGEAPIVQTGVWTTTQASQVEVILAHSDSPLTLAVVDGLLVTTPGEDTFGQAGLSLYRFRVIALNTLQLTVTGTVTYRPRIVLPPGAVLTVKLVDLSRADAPAVTIGEQVITDPGQGPIPFTITYKLADLNSTHTYAIRAQITAGDQLLFTTTSAYNVITQGNPDTVEVVLDMVSAAAPPEPLGMITLPDGSECRRAGPGATLAFDEKRLNYDCGTMGDKTIGLLGDLQVAGETLTVEKATIGRDASGFVLESSEPASMTMATVTLADDTVCDFAGQGATMAFAGKRLNYTCGAEGEQEIGLIGDFQLDGDLLLAEKATIGRDDSGFVLQSSALVGVKAVRGQTPPSN